MSNWLNKTHIGDCRSLMKQMAADGVRAQTCVTSPPYWQLRDYGVAGQIGLEPTLYEWIDTLVDVFRCVRDVLADDGTMWVNLGDSYTGGGRGGYPGGKSGLLGTTEGADITRQVREKHGIHKIAPGFKAKDLLGQPWRLAFALQDDGWYLRSDVIWSKPNPMPESVTDRPTKSHEYMFLLAKNEKYYYDQAAIREPCSPNTHARMGRAFAGYAPPGQTAHTGIMGPRAPGVNPKAAKKPPSDWDTGDGDHREKTGRYDNDHGAGQSERMGRGAGWCAKQNESFSEAISGEVVDDRNKRSVWIIPTEGFEGAHFATFPRALIEPCILAGAPAGGIVLDPFMGSGTTAQVATDLGRQFIGCELNAEYVALHDQRRTTQGMQF